ncbi:MAG TPA: hypothetical protein ENK49_06285 [Gammaproteobacteria bacterium]|nr:hypothetical protein [Gammaproteobacteria bacterium]
MRLIYHSGLPAQRLEFSPLRQRPMDSMMQDRLTLDGEKFLKPFLQYLSCACLLAVSLAAQAGAEESCAYVSRVNQVDGWPDVGSREALSRRITPGGVVNCSFFPDQEEKLNVLVRQEQGQYHGIGYRIFYTDGSGIIQGDADSPLDGSGNKEHWKLRCRKHPKDRPGECVLHKGDLFIHRFTDGSFMVDVGTAKKPGSELLVRIDDEAAFTADAQAGFNAEQTRRMLAQMATGERLTTRYQDAEKSMKSDRTISLFAYPQASAIVERVADDLFTDRRITAEQVREVIAATDRAADRRDTDAIGAYLGKAFMKYVDVPGAALPVTARVDREQYLDMIRKGWVELEDYSYQRKDVVVHVAPDGASAESNSTIVETITRDGQKMVSKVREYARYRIEGGRPVIVRLETQTLVGDTTPE